MQRRIVQIKSGNQIVNAIEQEFGINREEWNTYKLMDGGTVRLKTTLLKLFHVVDKDGNLQYDPDGNPVLVASHRADVVATR